MTTDVLRRSTPPAWAAFALALALVLLGGEMIRQGAADASLAERPGIAVLWRGESPDALAALARQRLAANDTHGAARLAAAALRRQPLQEGALVTWGLAQARLGRAAAADAAMTLAGRLSWRDELTQAWLFRRDLLALDFADALEHGDALMRREDAPPPLGLRILAAVAHDPRATAPLAERLAAAPAWRGAFFAFLAGSSEPAAPDLIGRLMSRLAAGPTPPTADEMAVYLRALIARQRFQDALRAWRALRPGGAEAGWIANGGFERTPAGAPFDWSLGAGVGWSAAIDEFPGERGKALNVQYDGASPPQQARQLVVLPPGVYRLAWRRYNETGAGGETLAWQVTCAGATRPLAAETPSPVAAGVWRPGSLDVTVPAANCPAQWVSLVAQPSETPTETSAWFDDVTLTSLKAGG